MTLGEKLKAYRVQQGLSQESVAETIGVSRQAVAKWEGGQSAPSSEHLIGLSKLYDVSLDELIAGSRSGDPEQERRLVQQERPEDPNWTILQANLTKIAIILQAGFLNAAMQPLPDEDIPEMRIAALVIRFVPLLAASLWMVQNLRYEKDYAQFRKNAKIEALYCAIQTSAALIGHYSQRYWLGTAMIFTIVLVYIFCINPKYMNRTLVKTKK